MILAAFAAAAAVSASTLGIDPKASVPLAPVAADHAPGSCHVRIAANGFPLPDPACTPGAVNPTLTLKVLTDPRFRTGMVRDKATSAAMKRKVYAWYGIAPPADNVGPHQVCELDHLVSIEVGGADTLDNVWVQCGPTNVPVGERYFKQKDAHAELGLAHSLTPTSDLSAIQHQLAADYTAFLDKKAEAYVTGAPQ